MTGVFCFYGNVLYQPRPFCYFILDSYTWAYDETTELGRFVSNGGNLVFDSICTITEMSFNILSLIWVHKTRKLVQTSIGASDNKKREIKLFAQSFILGCFFSAVYIYFVTLYALGANSLTTILCFQAVWTLNHSVNPLVYLSVNTKLRNRVLNILTCGKLGQ